jgi:predicted DsbA family dithiol-disulfide isomerase
MAKVELFFDNTCPYCYRGHSYLKELLPSYPKAEVVFCPVEAHPRVEEPEHRPYVDKAVQGAFYVREHGGDEVAFYDAVFDANFEQHRDVEDPAVLADCAAAAGVGKEGFLAALESGAYAKAQAAANDHAYEDCKVWAVPTYVSAAGRLDAVGGVGVTKEQVRDILALCNA